MALAARELELIIIAKDRASSTIARVGGALTIMGAGLTRLGVAWGQEMTEMAYEAAEFSRDAALAFTQMFDKTGAKVEDVNAMMERVARSTARPIEEIGDALFDVFSSLDVNVGEAETILKRVGQAAVAGNADMRAAMVPTIGMMNAFKLGAGDIDHILDVQFETVRKGIITYEEFTANIGKVIPAAVAAGQSMESMGSAYSFLTRQGLNAAMASTSVARAMELLTRPQTIANLEEIGIVVRNSEGEFLQMSEIVGQLGKRMDGMTGPERKQAFQDIFGTGTIQARRFFDTALANWEEYLQLQGEFEGSAGAMQAAYDIMFDEPMNKLQIMINRWQVLRKEIGDRVIPILEERVAPLIERVLDLWEGLTEEQKDTVAEWLALGSVATSVLGAVTTFIGIITLAAGIWKAFGVGIASILSGAGAVLGILTAIGVAAFLIWQNWDKVKAIWTENVLPALEELWAVAQPIIQGFIDWAKNLGTSAWEELLEVWETIKTTAAEIWEVVQDAFTKVWEVLTGIADRLDWDDIQKAWEEAWDKIAPTVEAAWEMVKDIISGVGDIIIGVVRFITDTITWIWENWGETIVTIIQGILEFLGQVFSGGLDILRGIFTFFSGLFTLDWSKMLEGIKLIWQGVWTTVSAFFEMIWNTIVAVATKVADWFMNTLWGPFTEWLRKTWETVWTAISDFFSGIWDGIQDAFKTALDWVTDIWEKVWEAVSEFVQEIWNSDIVQFLIDVVGIMYELLRIGLQTVWELWKKIWRGVANFFVERWNWVKARAAAIWGAIRGIASGVWAGIKAVISSLVAGVVGWVAGRWNAMKNTASMVWNNIKGVAITVWTAIKTQIERPIKILRTALEISWRIIKSAASTAWNNLKSTATTVWNNVKSAIVDPVSSAVDKVGGFFARIRDGIAGLWDKVKYYADKIREALRKLNPAEWFSPPLTAQVAGGFSTLKRQMVRDLKFLQDEAATRVGGIRAEMGMLARAEEEFNRSTRNMRTSGRAITNYNTTINTKAQSGQQVANELSWRLKLA